MGQIYLLHLLGKMGQIYLLHLPSLLQIDCS
jgi:hypothetical protein